MPDRRVGHVERAIGEARWMLSDEFESSSVASPDPDRGAAVSLQLVVDDCDAVPAHVVATGTAMDRGPEDSPPAGRVAGFRGP